MQEYQVINEVKKLSRIKPRNEWVLSAKNRILSDKFDYRAETSKDRLFVFGISNFTKGLRMIFHHKYAFSMALIAVFIFTAVNALDKALPGDFLYPAKKFSQDVRTVFVSGKDYSVLGLETANKRLEDLAKAAEVNSVKNLAPAISEYKSSVLSVAKDLKTEEIAKKDNIKRIAQEVKKLEENKQKIESLGVIIGETKELDDALAQLVEREIMELESKDLTEKQQKMLKEMKENYSEEKYTDALVVWLNNQ
ncbi:MAG: hypothetical protein PHI53_01545 [Candidatus Pacebacteria bacterium]|nr:hypothetical protein [Candidatus Paceibacterota bacterium]